MYPSFKDRTKHLRASPQDDIDIILHEKRKFIKELQSDPIWDCEETTSFTALIILILTGRILDQAEECNRVKQIDSQEVHRNEAQEEL